MLLATDAKWIRDEVAAALGGAGTTITVVNAGAAVVPSVKAQTPDLVVLDLQIGNMGGMATCMALRLDESGGRLPRVNVLMLLDRGADVFLAQRSGADGWLVKPLDSFRLRKAARALMAGGRYEESATVVDPVFAAAEESQVETGAVSS
ncbi:MAG: response regulator transcription factor [Acidimicrobiia bacterium]